MKTICPELEIRCLANLCNGKPEVQEYLKNCLTIEHFGIPEAKEVFHRVNVLINSNHPIPPISILKQDPVLSDEAKNLIENCKNFGKLKDIEQATSLVHQLNEYLKIRHVYGLGENVFQKLSGKNANFEEAVSELIHITDQLRNLNLEGMNFLTKEKVGVNMYLTAEPPEQDFLLENIMLKKSLCSLFAPGGTGKSFFLLQLAICLATGQTMGVFKPTTMNKVLYIGAEDPECELHRRIHLIAKSRGLLTSKCLAENLGVYSAVGQCEPLLLLDREGNPHTSSYYTWLEQSIKNLQGLEVLILDPMSRFYGLNENDNAHGTMWIQCLEKLAAKSNLSIIFAHHVSKAASNGKELSTMGRGAVSLRDGIRCALSMGEMTEKNGKKRMVNHRDFVEMDMTKANYTPKLPTKVYFKREEGGLLVPHNFLDEDDEDDIIERAQYFAGLIDDEKEISRSDIKKSKNEHAKNVKALLKKKYSTIDIDLVIDHALENGILCEVEKKKEGAKKSKMILQHYQLGE